MEDFMKVLLNKKEAAKLLHVSVRTIDTLRQTKNLPSHEIGGQIRFSEDELEAWLFGRDNGKRVADDNDDANGVAAGKGANV